MLADEIIERRQSVCRAYPDQLPFHHHIHDLRRGGIVRLALLEDVQQDIDVHRDGHLCLASKCPWCATLASIPGETMPLAATTSG